MKGLLKFITCGSVDDGKSTLIGHILYDAKLIYADQEKALELDSKVGSRNGAIDYSLLLDGLMAEREQGITIDVAYRYFTTDNRSFIVADTPGHEEYTRNMAVGASFADLAVILVDASQGVLVQTRRHARICKLMGIRYFVFAINKMDLVGYSKERFDEIVKQIDELKEELKLDNVKIIPLSATEGDNVTTKSENIKWYDGVPLLEYLETVDISSSDEEKGFYMPVQRVCRPDHTFRGFQGQIEAGSISVGNEIVALPSNEKANVKSVFVTDKEVKSAHKGQPVTITLDKEVDVSRGCVLSKNADIAVYKKLKVSLLWMDDEPLVIGKDYLVKLGTKTISGIITAIDYAVNVNTGEHIKTETLEKNGIAVCEILLTEAIVADLFSAHKTLGEIILIDRVTDSNLNHTGIYLYSKGKIMIHLTFDYKTDEKCTTPGQYLKYHRTFQGLSTRELAEKVGIVPATLVLYENDRHPIKHSTAVALANALGIDRNRLLDKYTAFVDYPYSSLLKKVRQDLSLTQIQMAELIGIGQTSYSGWEREIRVPRRKEYDKILAALEKLRVNVDTYLCQSASI